MLKPFQSELTRRAVDPTPTPIQDVRVNQRPAHVPVTQQLLDGADVVAGLQELCGKRMAEGAVGSISEQPAYRVYRRDRQRISFR